LVVLQIATDLENVRVFCTEMCPASSQDAYQDISIKAEVLSDVEEEEDPLAITFSGGIKAEPEVSCVYVRPISQIQTFLVLRNFATVNSLH
jgi:hypothetical protein